MNNIKYIGIDVHQATSVFAYGVKRRLPRHRKVDSVSISAHGGSEDAPLHLLGSHQTAVAAV